MKKLFALRGAVQCLNDENDIKKQTVELYDNLLQKNNLSEDGIVSIIFSVTQDLDAVNPAAALRNSGRGGELALFCVEEARVINSSRRTIRALLHCYMDEGAVPHHVYQNGAEKLRPDRV